MIEFPSEPALPLHLLASCFNQRSATYKFYWLMAIIESVESGSTKVRKIDLFSRMIADAWYPYNYFHLNFGIQDKLGLAIEKITISEGLTIDEKKHIIIDRLGRTENKVSLQALKYFNGEVPHRFLSPWYPGQGDSKMIIYSSSQVFMNNPLYALYDDEIVINPLWVDYIIRNSGVLKAFCFWHLSLYMQNQNPNVPDISGKLSKPATRGLLTKQRKEFWDIVFDRHGSVNCIYKKQPLYRDNYAVEHFLPYAFVSHDLIWNLIPADKSFNSSKSDRLPIFSKHFEPYCNLQILAIKTVKEIRPESKFLLEYFTLFPGFSVIDELDEHNVRKLFYEVLHPLLKIAEHNGFQYMYEK